MRIKITYLMLILTIAGTSVLSAQFGSGMVQNWDFQSGGSNWNSWGVPVTYGFDRGNQGFFATAQGVGAIEQVIPVDPFTKYKITVRMIFLSRTGRASIGVKGQNNAVFEQFETFEFNDNPPVGLTYELTVNSQASNSLVIYVYRPDEDSYVSVDTVKMEPVDSEPSPNLVVNPSFETEDSSGWTSTGTPQIASLSSNLYDGVKGAKIDRTSSLNQNIPTVPGKTYRFVAFARPEAGSTVNIGAKPSVESSDLYRVVKNSETWTQTELVFTATETSTLIYAFVPKEGDSAFVDNLIVQEITDNEKLGYGNFETSYFRDGFSNWTKSFGTLSLKNDGLARGLNSVLLEDGAVLRQRVGVVPNTSYELAINTKASDAITYGLEIEYVDDTKERVEAKSFASGWTKGSEVFTTKDRAIKNANFFVSIPRNNATGEVAAISLKKLDVVQLSSKSAGLKKVEAIAFPNPTRGLLTLNGVAGYKSLSIFGLLGNILYEQEIGNNNELTVDLSRLAGNSYYIVNLQDNNGHSTNLKVRKY